MRKLLIFSLPSPFGGGQIRHKILFDYFKKEYYPRQTVNFEELREYQNENLI